MFDEFVQRMLLDDLGGLVRPHVCLLFVPHVEEPQIVCSFAEHTKEMCGKDTEMFFEVTGTSLCWKWGGRMLTRALQISSRRYAVFCGSWPQREAGVWVVERYYLIGF
jgi:hypothetical protein